MTKDSDFVFLLERFGPLPKIIWICCGNTTNKRVRDPVEATEHYSEGFNIGINNGIAVRQTGMHLHVRLIPWYTGGQSDPRGGSASLSLISRRV